MVTCKFLFYFSCSIQYGPVFLSVFATVHPGENNFKINRHKDNTVDLRFHLFEVIANRKPEINTLYVEIVELLRQKTNFLSLENQEQYLIALARMLEAAVFQLDISNMEGQKILKLAGLLRIEDDLTIISGSKTACSQHIDTRTLTNHNTLFCKKRTCPLLEYSRRRQMCPKQTCHTTPSSGILTPQNPGSDGG